jgi:hypothetical protein
VTWRGWAVVCDMGRSLPLGLRIYPFSPASSRSCPVQSVTRDRMFFQGSPVSGSKQCLGRQNAGGRAPGDSFGADEFRHGLAIVIVHRLLPHHDFAIRAVFAGQSSTSRTAKRLPAYCDYARTRLSSRVSSSYRQQLVMIFWALSAYDITPMF